jgi:hypothetical protein
MFLDYVNNYLTLELFAEHNGISIDLATLIIKEGRIQHELKNASFDALTTPQQAYFINNMEY